MGIPTSFQLKREIKSETEENFCATAPLLSRSNILFSNVDRFLTDVEDSGSAGIYLF